MFFEIFDIKNIKHIINSDKIIQIKEYEAPNACLGVNKEAIIEFKKTENFLIVCDCSESIVVPKNAYSYLDEILKIIFLNNCRLLRVMIELRGR